MWFQINLSANLMLRNTGSIKNKEQTNKWERWHMKQNKAKAPVTNGQNAVAVAVGS